MFPIAMCVCVCVLVRDLLLSMFFASILVVALLLFILCLFSSLSSYIYTILWWTKNLKNLSENPITLSTILCILYTFLFNLLAILLLLLNFQWNSFKYELNFIKLVFYHFFLFHVSFKMSWPVPLMLALMLLDFMFFHRSFVSWFWLICERKK